jgi:serine/threonine protein kinase
MKSPCPDDSLLTAAWPDAERLLQQFEEAWRSGALPQMETFLAPLSVSEKASNGPARQEFLKELIRVDLEYRWRQRSNPAIRPRVVPDYARLYPELDGNEPLLIELIGEEYRARRRWGDRPGRAEYAARLTQQETKLQEMLQRIDAELAAEFGPEPPKDQGPGLVNATDEPAGQPLVSAAALLDALRQSQLLSQSQLSEFKAGNWADAKALAGNLLKRGWLTPYQVNQLLQGRAQELLVGPYLLLERLGEGGAGQVFKARHQKMNRVVALKIIRKELLSDAEVVGRFYREIQVLSQLDHPNIVHAYDAGPITPVANAPGSPGRAEQRELPGSRGHYLAMAYVEGTDLGKLVKQGGPLPVQQACAYLRQAALGLQHAHERGLVHRDIKPHNLIMSLREGLIKVADLGLARLPRAGNAEVTAAISGGMGTGTLTPEHAVLMGTADYLAPEQALDFHKADIRADIYSLGCTFYFLLTGQPPFAGGGLAQKVTKHLHAEPQPVDKFRQDLPAGLNEVLRKMLAKRPEDRYQTPGEVSEALASYSNAASQVGSVGPGVLAQALRWNKWSRRRVFAGLLGGMVAAAAGYWLLTPLTPFQRLRRKLTDPGTTLDEARAEYRKYQDSTSRHPDAAEVEQALEMMRSYLLDLRVRAPGTGSAVDAGWRLTQLPSPLDKLPDGRSPYFPETIAEGQWSKSEGDSRKILQLAISPNCKMVAGGRADGTVDLWSGYTGTKSFTLSGHKGPITGLAFSPDSKQLASAALDKAVKLWDLARRAESKSFEVPRPAIVAFAPDGKTVAMTGHDWTDVILWNVDTGEKHSLKWGVPTNIRSLAFSPNGQTLALLVNGVPKLWSLPAETERKIAGLPTANRLAFAPDGQTIALAMHNGPIQLWDSAMENRLKNVGGRRADPGFLTFTPDGQRLLDHSEWDGGYRTGLLEIATGQNLWSGWFGSLVALAADGRHIALIDNGRGLMIRIPTKYSR